MRETARAIMVRGRQLLVVRRHRVIDGEHHDYLSIPGGGIETGETALQAVMRELGEELDLIPVGQPRLMLTQTLPEQMIMGERHDERRHHYFAVEVSDEYVPHLRAASEEAHRAKPGENEYEPMWVSIDVLPVPLHEDYRQEVWEAIQQLVDSRPTSRVQ